MNVPPSRKIGRNAGRNTGLAIMRSTPKSFLALVLSATCVFSLGVDVTPLLAASASPSDKTKKLKLDPALKGLPISELNADEAVLHALNRLAYGPRPGDVERVKQMGLAKWIDQQLNPNSIDDRAVQARLENYPTLAMSSTQLMRDYPQPKQAEKQAAKLQAQNASQTRSDAAAAVVARDSQNSGNSANASTSTAQDMGPTYAAQNAPGEMNNSDSAPVRSNANSTAPPPIVPSPMKDEPAELRQYGHAWCRRQAKRSRRRGSQRRPQSYR